ncbi:serine/threonine-protein kinase [Mycobacterium sp. NPDC003449]
MALDVGSVVAGYRIEAVLGEGGMGTVYRVAHPTLPRSDALKVLHSDRTRADHFRVRFLREADLAAQLDHPHIVSVYDRGETQDGLLWIAMQYVAGSDADRETLKSRMTPARTVKIVAAVADALDYAHRRGLLHRDVKPANFLLAENDERIFLADFGIARAADDDIHLTQTGMVMASLAYAAPESLTGEKVDHRADIYALGCSMYRMLTGKTPFAGDGGGALAVTTGHLSLPPPRPTDRLPHLPPAIDAVVAKAMAKDPRQRYQSARELAADAAAALDDTTTVIKTRPVPPGRGGTGWPSPPSPVAPAQTDPPYYPQPEVTYPSGWYSAPNQVHTEAAPFAGPPAESVRPKGSGQSGQSRKRMLIAAAVIAVVLAAGGAGVWALNRGPGEPSYSARTLSHVHGTTELTARPKAVAAIGPGDADAVLALGVQPVAIGSPTSALPGWEQSAVTSDPAVLTGFTDTSAVAAAKPDVIIATGDLDDSTFAKLEAIAPTVTRPTDAAEKWRWQNHLTWVGQILGYDDKAKQLIDGVRSQQDDVKNQNPAFSGKSVEAVIYSDTGVAEVLTPSTAADYLESIGFRYRQDLATKPTDTGETRPMPDPAGVYSIETDALVVIRTDSAAGSGGFAGLPPQFNGYQGKLVIVDDPDTVAALTGPGGYLANQHLNDALVPELSRQIQ